MRVLSGVRPRSFLSVADTSSEASGSGRGHGNPRAARAETASAEPGRAGLDSCTLKELLAAPLLLRACVKAFAAFPLLNYLQCLALRSGTSAHPFVAQLEPAVPLRPCGGSCTIPVLENCSESPLDTDLQNLVCCKTPQGRAQECTRDTNLA